MRKLLRISVVFISILLSISALTYFFWYKPGFNPPKPDFTFPEKAKGQSGSLAFEKIHSNASSLEKYCSKKRFNTSYCFMVDMSIPSGKNRFMVYDFKKQRVELAGLVTHGSGSKSWIGSEMSFSNVPGSSCTSLGKYRIGKPYQGRFGLAYKLYGLDNTNSKAFERFVVLHAHSCVPAKEVYPLGICNSLGCPTVSPAFLKKLSGYIDESNEPILLTIYK